LPSGYWRYRIDGVSNKSPSGTSVHLDGHLAAQRLAYRCVESVADRLRPGVTERDAAHMLRRELADAGVVDWFHVPFVWFGDRTAFRGLWTPLHFFPTNRSLTEDMPFILDVAPVVDDYVADIGYAGCLGVNPVQARLRTDLRLFRELILAQVRERRPLRDIYRSVDALITELGYENRHRVYPGRVIAHQVGRVRGPGKGMVTAGFGVRALQTLGRELVSERVRGRSPLWADGAASNHPPTPGLWAVEPHLGLRDVGAKFEELLVVTEDDAYWLDDEPPHVRYWQEATV
jgi:Xaa-Pro aminopeptidase